MELMEAIKSRRSCYSIGKENILGKDKIEEIVYECIKSSPSGFNAQSSRVVILFGKEHDRLWDIVMESLRKIVEPEKFGRTENKVNGFKGGYGTVLFFDDENITDNLKEKFPLYIQNIIPWAEQSNGMLQISVWMALEENGLGVSLQHYNEVIAQQVKLQWNIDQKWRMIAQMPFGCLLEPPIEKVLKNTDERIRIYGELD